MLRVDYGKKFSKQAEKCKRRGKNMQKLRDVVLTISNGEPLAEKHRNHYLENRKRWDCHIEPDWDSSTASMMTFSFWSYWKPARIRIYSKKQRENTA